jgi:N-acetylmuramoyl-L-alanine amidase
VRITLRPTPNQKHVPRRVVTAIVLHYTGTLATEPAVRWMQRPDAHLSAHYVIERDGAVIQMVPEDAVAFHAGRSAMDPATGAEANVNEFSVGIMLVGTADSGFTDVQMAALYTLVEVLVVRHRVHPDRIVGHRHIAPGRQQDPDGFTDQFNWRRLHEVATKAFTHAHHP